MSVGASLRGRPRGLSGEWAGIPLSVLVFSAGGQGRPPRHAFLTLGPEIQRISAQVAAPFLEASKKHPASISVHGNGVPDLQRNLGLFTHISN